MRRFVRFIKVRQGSSIKGKSLKILNSIASCNRWPSNNRSPEHLETIVIYYLLFFGIFGHNGVVQCDREPKREKVNCTKMEFWRKNVKVTKGVRCNVIAVGRKVERWKKQDRENNYLSCTKYPDIYKHAPPKATDFN